MKRPLLAEALGTALLLYAIVGSGIAADRLASDDAVALFAHAASVGLALTVLIAMFGTVSGAHFNPAVTLGLWRAGMISTRLIVPYIGAQVAGAIAGVVVANVSFGVDAFAVAATDRMTSGTFISEVMATLVLMLLILMLVRAGRAGSVAPAVGAWVAAAIFATSSTGFANPAVTVARALTDTYTGIAPGSVPGFVLAQLVGAGLAVAIGMFLVPRSEMST
ncbi:MAG: aquaporin [Acidimicrobiia bacterium]|nr:aquaporin [Acidimicrobiia bacterium]